MKRILALLAAVVAFFAGNALLVVLATLGVISLIVFWVRMAGMLN